MLEAVRVALAQNAVAPTLPTQIILITDGDVELDQERQLLDTLRSHQHKRPLRSFVRVGRLVVLLSTQPVLCQVVCFGYRA